MLTMFLGARYKWTSFLFSCVIHAAGIRESKEFCVPEMNYA